MEAYISRGHFTRKAVTTSVITRGIFMRLTRNMSRNHAVT